MPQILVVDDNAVDRLLFDGLLSKVVGFTVVQAENGKEALAKIKEWRIDLVVTDLQMPEMDGLELVETMRTQFPSVPAILVTGVGSEEIATRALNAGAASYVPKSKAAALLVSTIKNLLELMHEEHSFERLLATATQTKFEFTLNNDEGYFPAIIELCLRMLEGMSPLDKIELLRIGIAIEHALNNALYHGNLEISEHWSLHGKKHNEEDFAEMVQDRQSQFSKRLIKVGLDIRSSYFECRIRDQGQGFTPENHTRVDGKSGRGLILMQTFMDEVKFEDAGREVRLRRIWEKSDSALDDCEATETAADGAGRVLGTLRCTSVDLEFELKKPIQIVGSASTCHIVIDDRNVDPHHCRLTLRKGAWFCEALKGASIWINDKPTTRSALKTGDEIRIGNRVYKIQYDATD